MTLIQLEPLRKLLNCNEIVHQIYKNIFPQNQRILNLFKTIKTVKFNKYTTVPTYFQKKTIDVNYEIHIFLNSFYKTK